MPKASRARWALAAVVLAAGSLRCSLVTSLDGLSSPNTSDGAAPQDAAVGEGSPPDASPKDASLDGGDAGRWCDSLSPAPFFCDDFDDEGPFSRWTGQNQRTGGTVARDRTAFLSAPNAFLAVSPPAATASSAALYVSTSTVRSKIHIAYDMRIDARDSSVGYAEINVINFTGPNLPFNVYTRVYNDVSATTILTSEIYFPDAGLSAQDTTLTGTPRFDVWTHVLVDVDLASSPHTLKATINGTVAALQTLDSSLFTPSQVTVNLGVGYTGHPSTTDWRVRYDNVTVDWE